MHAMSFLPTGYARRCVPRFSGGSLIDWLGFVGAFLSHLLELNETTHMLVCNFCLARPWLSSCQCTFRFFFDSIAQ